MVTFLLPLSNGNSCVRRRTCSGVDYFTVCAEDCSMPRMISVYHVIINTARNVHGCSTGSRQSDMHVTGRDSPCQTISETDFLVCSPSGGTVTTCIPVLNLYSEWLRKRVEWRNISNKLLQTNSTIACPAPGYRSGLGSKSGRSAYYVRFILFYDQLKFTIARTGEIVTAVQLYYRTVDLVIHAHGQLWRWTITHEGGIY